MTMNETQTAIQTAEAFGLTFPLALEFQPADKLNAADDATVLRVASKAAKKGEKAPFAPYAVVLPAVTATADPILRAALQAGLFYVIRGMYETPESKKPFIDAGWTGSPVTVELGDVEFCKLVADALSSERAAGKKLTADEIKETFRALRAGFERLTMERERVSSLDALPDAKRTRMQADLMRIELAMTKYASTTYRPETPDEADRHIRMLTAIGTAAQKLNTDAGECWPMIQGRIAAYLESVAKIEECDDEGLF